jgi:hypothetical protein
VLDEPRLDGVNLAVAGARAVAIHFLSSRGGRVLVALVDGSVACVGK